MDNDFIKSMLFISIWTLANVWFWTLVPISLIPGHPYAAAWAVTACVVWFTGMFIIVQEPWKKR